MIEVELKFEIEDESIDTIKRKFIKHKILDEKSCKEVSMRAYETIYLDTANKYFQKNNCVLRLRINRNKQDITLDFKADISVAKDVFKRLELSRKLSSDNVGDISFEDVNQLLAKSFENKKTGINIDRKIIQEEMMSFGLISTFKILMERQVFLIREADSHIELSFDDCHIIAEDKKIHFVEVEAELVKGLEKDILTLKNKIRQVNGIREVNKSKFQRGLELLS